MLDGLRSECARMLADHEAFSVAKRAQNDAQRTVQQLERNYSSLLRRKDHILKNQKIASEHHLTQQLISMREKAAAYLELRLAEQERDLRLFFDKERAARLDELDALRDVSETLESALKYKIAKETELDNVRELSRLVASLEDLIPTSEPLSTFWTELRDLASRDPVLDGVMQAAPKGVETSGVCSMDELQRWFPRVERALRQSAMVPDNSSSLWGPISGAIFGRMLMKEHWLAPGLNVDSAISRAGYFVDQGDLQNAVRELESIHDPIGTDWLNEAKRRLCLDQAFDAIRAHSQLEDMRIG
eukprot:GABV01000451.1.p1 GENE.GABV01000451.1~~GABV01000451.1.p1  ORF type:complete len:302 (+),score=63.68 GABV01000451.1:373-1278(+)